MNVMELEKLFQPEILNIKDLINQPEGIIFELIYKFNKIYEPYENAYFISIKVQDKMYYKSYNEKAKNNFGLSAWLIYEDDKCNIKIISEGII